MTEWYPSSWEPGARGAGDYAPAADAVPVTFEGGGPLDGREGHSRDALSALWVVATPSELVVRSAVEQPRDLPAGWRLLGRYVMETQGRVMLWRGLEIEEQRPGFILTRLQRIVRPRPRPTVTLRAFRPSDADMLDALNDRPDVIARFGSPVRIDDGERWGVQVIEANGRAVGVAGLLPSHIERGCLELVCAVTLGGEGQGIATEASRLLIHGTTQGGRILASIAPGNERAQRLAYLLGFRYVRMRPVSMLAPEPEQVWELHPRPIWWRRIWSTLRDGIRKLKRIR